MDAPDAQAIEAARRKVVEEHGEWTSHNVQLAPGVYTRSASDPAGCAWLLPVLAPFARRPFGELRVLDLACLEGLYAIEFARLGARVLGIEARRTNLAKAEFAKEVLRLDRLELVQDDVRNLSRDRHGLFDLVLCSGILYHLDAPDLAPFARRLAEVCTGFLYLNTHVAPSDADLGDNPGRLGPLETIELDGRPCVGRRYPEHPPESSTEDREKRLWASIDNPFSFWLTRDSLCELLTRAGFGHVYQCLTTWNTPDRVALIATKP